MLNNVFVARGVDSPEEQTGAANELVSAIEFSAVCGRRRWYARGIVTGAEDRWPTICSRCRREVSGYGKS
eukprot:2928533-Pleurochrysis_carterae.AAC.3